MTAAELEIALHRRDAESYHVDLRFLQPGSSAIIRPTDSEVGPLRVDRDALLKTTDPAEYGRQLAQQLFTAAKVAAAFGKARAVAQSQDAALRVRLFIGPSAPELHNLRWETLLDPSQLISIILSNIPQVTGLFYMPQMNADCRRPSYQCHSAYRSLR